MSKCSESNGEAVQLGVVRALLTVTTAEHFVLHGDCLMQARDTSLLQARAALQLPQAGSGMPLSQQQHGLPCKRLVLQQQHGSRQKSKELSAAGSDLT